MSFVFPTNASQVQAFAGALYGVQVGSTTMAQVNADILANGGLAKTLNAYYAASFGGVANAAVANTVATNLGLTGAALTSGVAYITAQLNAAAADARGAVISNIVNLFGTLSADATFGAAATAWNAKVAVAAAYTGAANVAVGTVVAAQGTMFTLTTSVEQVTGTSGADTFYGTHTTLNSGDVVNGGDGSDTLSVTTNTASGTAFTALPTLSSVETVSVTNLNAGSDTSTVNLVNSTGVTALVNKSSSQSVTFSNAQAAASVTVDGATAGTTTATFRNSLASGTADSVNLAVANGATAVFEVTGVTNTNVFETVNLASSGATKNTASFGATTAAGIKTLNVTGAGEVAVSLETTASKAVYDGSAATGKQTVSVAAGDTGTASAFYVETVRTGSGNDVVDVTDRVGGSQSATTFFGSTAPKTIAGGEGQDTLVISESITNLTSNSTTGVLHSVTGIETVQGNYSNATSSATTPGIAANAFPDATIYGQLAASSSGANTLAVSRLGAAQKVQLSATQSSSGVNNLTVSQNVTSGAADAITVELISPNTNTSTTTPAANVIGTITVATGDSDAANTETLNLVATNLSFTAAGATTATAGSTVAAITAQTTSNLVITGAGGLTVSGLVDLRAPVGTAKQNIDASGMTGNLTLGAIGTAGVEDVAVSVKGGSGADRFYFNTTVGTTDEISGGAGADILYVTDSSTAATLAPTTSGVETLTIRTVNGGAKSFSLANMTDLTTVNLTSDGGTAAVSAAAYGSTVSNINGHTVNFVTAAAGTSSGSATAFASTTTNLRGATGVTNVTATIKGDGTAISNPTIATNVGQITIQNSNVVASTGFYNDNSVTVSGTSATGDTTALSRVVLSGNGLKDATTRATLTVANSATAGVTAITNVDATALAGDLNIASMNLEAGATVSLGATGTNTTTVSAAQLAADASRIVGGAGTNTVAVTGVTGATALRPATTSVETVSITTVEDGDSNLADLTVDFRDTSGVTSVRLAVAADTSGSNVATNDQSITLSNLANNTTVSLGGTDADGTTYGTSSDTLTISAPVSGATAVTLNNTAAGNVTVLDATFGSTYRDVAVRLGASKDMTFTTLQGSALTGITIGGNAVSSTSGLPFAGAISVGTLTAGNLTNLTADTTQGAITVGSSAMTASKLATVTATGTNAFNFGASSATTTALATFDASGMSGDVTIGQGVDFTSSASIKTGVGSDSIWMNIQSFANVTVDAGANTHSGGSVSTSGSDTLRLQGAMNAGLTVVDLSSTTDQLTQANGAVNTAAQIGFESVDGSALTGSFAMNVTGSSGANTIVGTGNVDNIVAGGGADNITGGAGADTIDITETTQAVDTLVFASVAGISTSDTITGFIVGTGGDVLRFTEAATTDLVGSTAAASVSFEKGTVSALTASTAVTTADNVIVITDNITLDGAGVQSALAAIHAGDANIGNGVIVVATDGTNVKVFYDAAIASGASVEIATLVGITIDNLVSGNFTLGFAG